MFYLNTIEQLFLFVEQLEQLEVCLPYSRLLAGITILTVFQNLRWNSNKISLKLFTGTYVVCRSQNTTDIIAGIDVLFEFHLKFWNTTSIGIPVRSLL